MRQRLTDLCAILEEQKDVLKNMLELAKEERQIIINNESDKLESVVRLEFKELSKLGGIEKRRLSIINAIAMDLQMPVNDITVTKIAEKAEPDERRAIRKLQEELTPLIEEHTALNKENRQLIEAHIEYSQTMMELMVGSEDPLNNMYGGDGRTNQEIKKNMGLYDGHA